MKPLTDAQRMTCLAKHGHHSLFRIHGKPCVLKRTIKKVTNKRTGIKESIESEDWLPLDSPAITGEARKHLSDAWSDWQAWASDMARGADA
jgi:hypothetical protein